MECSAARRFGELSVGFGMVLDHLARKGLDRIAVAHLLGEVGKLHFGETSTRRRQREGPVG
jgi:hypothetical protein